MHFGKHWLGNPNRTTARSREVHRDFWKYYRKRRGNVLHTSLLWRSTRRRKWFMQHQTVRPQSAWFRAVAYIPVRGSIL